MGNCCEIIDSSLLELVSSENLNHTGQLTFTLDSQNTSSDCFTYPLQTTAESPSPVSKDFLRTILEDNHEDRPSNSF